jgi:hypothetical protein
LSGLSTPLLVLVFSIWYWVIDPPGMAVEHVITGEQQLAVQPDVGGAVGVDQTGCVHRRR